MRGGDGRRRGRRRVAVAAGLQSGAGKLNGRLLPLGWIRALRGKRKIDEVRVFALGVKPEYQHTGVAAGLYRDIWDAVPAPQHLARRDRLDSRGQRSDESGDGGPHGRIVKRYRLYERLLDADAAPAFPGGSS